MTKTPDHYKEVKEIIDPRCLEYDPEICDSCLKIQKICNLLTANRSQVLNEVERMIDRHDPSYLRRKTSPEYWGNRLRDYNERIDKDSEAYNEGVDKAAGRLNNQPQHGQEDCYIQGKPDCPCKCHKREENDHTDCFDGCPNGCEHLGHKHDPSINCSCSCHSPKKDTKEGYIGYAADLLKAKEEIIEELEGFHMTLDKTQAIFIKHIIRKVKALPLKSDE